MRLPIDILLQLAQLEQEVKGNSQDIDNIFTILKELIEKQSNPVARNKIGFKQYDIDVNEAGATD